MAKIGTAQIEIKPVLDEAALTAITDKIAEAVQAGVRRGMRDAKRDDTDCPDCHGSGYVHHRFIGVDGTGVRSERCPFGCPVPVLHNLDPDSL